MRSWPGLAAIGAGLIHLGIAAGSSPLVLVAFVLVGAAEAGWGVVALSRTAPPRARAAFSAAALLVAAWIAVLVAGGAPHDHAGRVSAPGAAAAPGTAALPIGAVTGAGVLDLALTVLLAVPLRRSGAVRPAELSPLRFLLGTAAGAGVVAVVTASSLAATAVGGRHLH